jgi:regulator of protease activity HflC (stomatin/prohibitin superfamily)
MYGISASWVSNRLVAAALSSPLSFPSPPGRGSVGPGVVLRLGRFRAAGTGTVFYRTDHRHHSLLGRHRVIASSFYRGTHTHKDTVPVNVDAVLFWKVVDPMKAALDVADYRCHQLGGANRITRRYRQDCLV